MNIVTIYADCEDAEKLAVILLKSENSFSVERCDDGNDHGYLFTVTEREEDDEN